VIGGTSIPFLKKVPYRSIEIRSSRRHYRHSGFLGVGYFIEYESFLFVKNQGFLNIFLSGNSCFVAVIGVASIPFLKRCHSVEIRFSRRHYRHLGFLRVGYGTLLNMNIFYLLKSRLLWEERSS
jgi:hypothetical protein